MNSEFTVATHCLLLLACDSSNQHTSSQIAERLSVHPVRIRKILSLLKKHGYIESREGIKGGFHLLKNPSSVTLDEIYQLTQKNILKPRYHEYKKNCPVGQNFETVVSGILNESEMQLLAHLKKYTLDEVLNELRKSGTTSLTCNCSHKN